MQVKILKKSFSGVEFSPEMRVLHLGGQTSAGVERLDFVLPEEWDGCAVTLHIQRQDGTLPTPILLDENHSAAVGKEFTAGACGSWMLLALGENGYRALTRPAKYDCYETLATDGDTEISPTQYETFVAQVLGYANGAQSAAREARNAAAAAKRDADTAENARTQATAAADRADAAQESAGADADRAEAAALRAENFAPPEDGAVVSVNGKGGRVVLGAEDVSAVPEKSAGYVKSITLEGRTLTLTLGDGSVRTMQTQDTANLENMAGILDTEHGGTGKAAPLTAQDVGAVDAKGAYVKSITEKDGTLNIVLGDGTALSYSLPTATALQPGCIKVGEGFTVAEDGTLQLEVKGVEAYPVGSIYQSTDPTSPAALFGGTWEQIASERVLMGASSTHAAGTTVNAGLPNITGFIYNVSGWTSSDNKKEDEVASGAFKYKKGEYSSWNFEAANYSHRAHKTDFDASLSNAIYGASSTVQPAAYYVYIWHRVA